MDTKTLDRMAKNNIELKAGATLFERWYYISLRGMYAQYKSGQITLGQAQHDKEVIEDAFEKHIKGPDKVIVHLNKEQVVDAITLELGRYISCAMTNENREKAYPRELFNKRILMVIDDAYSK